MLITKLKEERRVNKQAYAKTWENLTQEDLDNLTNLMDAKDARLGTYVGDKVTFKLGSKEYTFYIWGEYFFMYEKANYKKNLELIKKKEERY